jgi:hypothetical protein
MVVCFRCSQDPGFGESNLMHTECAAGEGLLEDYCEICDQLMSVDVDEYGNEFPVTDPLLLNFNCDQCGDRVHKSCTMEFKCMYAECVHPEQEIDICEACVRMEYNATTPGAAAAVVDGSSSIGEFMAQVMHSDCLRRYRENNAFLNTTTTDGDIPTAGTTAPSLPLPLV